MNAWMVSPPIAEHAGRYLMWPAFWTSLAVLAAGCLLLLRSRWARSHPLHRYILLSILAHLVLVGCAATVHIVLAPPEAQQVVQVTVLNTDEDLTATEEPPPTAAHQFASDVSQDADLAEDSPIAQQPAPGHDQHHPLQAAEDASSASTPDQPDRLERPNAQQASNKLDAHVGSPPSAGRAENPRADDPTVASALPEAAMPPGQASDPPQGDLPPANEEEPDWPAETQPQHGSSTAAITSGMLEPKRELTSTGPCQSTDQWPSGRSESGEIPERLAEVPPVYAWRALGSRRERALAAGGSDETEQAVEAALAWLAQTQSAGGQWEARRFGAGQESWINGQNRQGAGAKADAGVTGLALLAYLGAGYTHLQGDYQETVAAALEYLLRIQDPSGHLAGNADPYAFMYCHGMACLALGEAYAMTRDKSLEPAVRRAVDYTLSAQHSQTGGWRYRPGEVGDTSQLGWQLMALMSAEHAGVAVPHRSYLLASRFLDSVAAGTSRGLASYRPQERPTSSMTAEALVCRYLLAARESAARSRGSPPEPQFALAVSTEREATAFLLRELPGTSHDNVYYWYYGTLAMYQAGGEAWQRWNQALAKTLLARQRRAGHLAGSWDPDRVWGNHGGRVYSTAMCALCLEVYYRYLPLYRLAHARPPGYR